MNNFMAIPWGRRFSPNWADLSEPRKWLNECDDKHGGLCEKLLTTEVDPGPIRLLDLKYWCIVESDSPCPYRYVALVYAPSNVAAFKLRPSNVTVLKEAGALCLYADALSRAFLDAMEAAKALGERYLWIDALVRVPSLALPREDRTSLQG